MTTRYVRLAREQRQVHGRWCLETRMSILSGSPFESGVLSWPETLAVFAVDGCRSNEAALGAVAEWLFLGRPSAMTVREVVSRVPAAAAGRGVGS